MQILGGSSWFVGLCESSAIKPSVFSEVSSCTADGQSQIVSGQECQGLYVPTVSRRDLPNFLPHLQQLPQALTTAAAPVVVGNSSLHTQTPNSTPRADRLCRPTHIS